MIGGLHLANRGKSASGAPKPFFLSSNVSAYTYYSYRRNVQELLTRHHLDLKMALLSRPLRLSQESDENDRGSFGISEEWSF